MFSGESKLRATGEALLAGLATLAVSAALGVTLVETGAADRIIIPAVGSVLFPDGIVHSPVFDPSAPVVG